MSILADRRFFVHAPHNAVGLSPGMLTWQPGAAPLPAKRAARRLCLVSALPPVRRVAVAAGFVSGAALRSRPRPSRTRGDPPGWRRFSCWCMALPAQRLAPGQQLEQCGVLRRGRLSGVDRAGCVLKQLNMEAEILLQWAERIPGSSELAVEPPPFAEGHPILRAVEG